MRYKGLIEDQELFQCTFLLVLGISTFLEAFISLIFIIAGIPYSFFMFLCFLIVGIKSILEYKGIEKKLEERQKEFEAHERKENRELET